VSSVSLTGQERGMNRIEPRDALIRQLGGMPPETHELGAQMLTELDRIEDDADYVRSTDSVIRALKVIEYMATGVLPGPDLMQ
jgi:hypothetical protein